MNLFRFSKPLMIVVAISSLVACAENPMNSTAKASASDEKIAALQSDMKTLNANVADMKKTVDAMYKLITAKIQQNAPKPPVTSLELGTDPTLGDHSAKVAIVEYSDYQCPFCGAFEKRTMPLLKKQYIDTGKVQFIYRDFPLEFHPHAAGAAIAANCAGEQHAYWRMHDKLFANQTQLGTKLYTDMAKQLHLDAKQFDTCLKDEKSKQQLSEATKQGEGVGVEGTPAFFVGRIEGDKLVEVKSLVGAQPAGVFTKLIDSYLN